MARLWHASECGMLVEAQLLGGRDLPHPSQYSELWGEGVRQTVNPVQIGPA